MSRLTRDGTTEPVSQDQIIRHARGQCHIHFPCSADHEQDWQPYPVDPYSAIRDDYTYIHTYIREDMLRVSSIVGPPIVNNPYIYIYLALLPMHLRVINVGVKDTNYQCVSLKRCYKEHNIIRGVFRGDTKVRR